MKSTGAKSVKKKRRTSKTSSGQSSASPTYRVGDLLWELTVPEKLPSLNYTNKLHFLKKNALKQQWKRTVRSLCSGLPRSEGPVQLTITTITKRKPWTFDVDNLAPKFLLDGLTDEVIKFKGVPVRGFEGFVRGILPDDNASVIPRVVLTYRYGKEDATKVQCHEIV